MAQYSFEALKDEYLDLWDRMKVLKVNEANSQARRIITPAAKSIYKAVEVTTGVPWFVIGCLHMRESNGRFDTWLHNGDPMRRNGVPVRTVNVPAHRPPDPNVSWETGAYDALVVCEHLDLIKDWGPEHVAYAAEKFNGFGYRHPSRNIPSPYLWGGTSVQKRGKFVRDGFYDPNVMDSQLGAMAVLKQIMELDPDARFEVTRPRPRIVKPEPKEAPPPLSPRADDGQSQVQPSKKSFWGAIMSWLGGNGGILAAVFDKLDNPYTLAALVIVVLATSIGLYLVLSGRLDTTKIMKHLSRDDTQDASNGQS